MVVITRDFVTSNITSSISKLLGELKIPKNEVASKVLVEQICQDLDCIKIVHIELYEIISMAVINYYRNYFSNVVIEKVMIVEMEIIFEKLAVISVVVEMVEVVEIIEKAVINVNVYLVDLTFVFVNLTDEHGILEGTVD